MNVNFGDDPGQGALWGAVGAGAGILAGYGVGQLNIGNPYVQFGVSMAAGGLLSGGTSALAGGDFVQGFQNGAIGAAAGYFASMGISKILRQSQTNASPGKGEDKAIYDLTQGGEEFLKVSGQEWRMTPDHRYEPNYCPGEWRQMGWDPIGLPGPNGTTALPIRYDCRAYWMCFNCAGGQQILWDGNYRSLPYTKGVRIYTGYGEGLKTGNVCLARSPGPQNGCHHWR